MGALLDTLSIAEGNPTFHSAEFLAYIASHMLYIKQNGLAETPIDPGLSYKFEFNFFSLLVEMKLNFEDFGILLLVNGFKCPTEMTRAFKVLKMPSEEVITRLKQLYQYQNKRV